MKKSRIFMSLGALVLVFAGVLASKANKKFISYTSTVYLSSGVSSFVTLIKSTCTQSDISNWDLVTTSGTIARFETKTLYGVNTTTSPATFYTLYY